MWDDCRESIAESIVKSTRLSVWVYRGTSLIRNTPLLGPYGRTLPRVLWWSEGEELSFISEVSF